MVSIRVLTLRQSSLTISLQHVGGLNNELIEALPASLKIVVTCSVGFDHYDAEGLAKRGIVLCNSPGLAASPVADHVLFQTLALYRHYAIFEHLTRKSRCFGTARAAPATSGWDTEHGRPLLHENNKSDPSYSPENDTAPSFSFGAYVGNRPVCQPRDHTVGIVGFGAIGKEIGQRLAGIGMNVHYTKRTRLSDVETKSLGYPVTFHETLESLLSKSELLVLACPLTPKTRYIINETTLQLLPRDAKIINIGRGPLINTKDLIQSLKSGRITGAALDVMETEPLVDPELCDRWDVILTPHIGSSTIETADGAEEICVNNIINVLFGDGKSITKVL